MFTDFLTSAFESFRERDAIIWQEQVFSYRWLLERVEHWKAEILLRGISPGSVVAVEADFSPNAVALFLVLTDRGCTLVPLTRSVAAKKEEFIAIAQCEVVITIDEHDHVSFSKIDNAVSHPILMDLKGRGTPGLILFSSGSTGKSKAAVHDLVALLEKFKVQRHARSSIAFLLFDHIGGVNTMLYQLSNGGCIVSVQDRSPDVVLGAIEEYRVEMLPTSPTFLNLVLLSEAYERHDLDSLQLVTYGTEPMPESTLERFHEMFPNIRLLQTYGLSEVGILRSKSKSSDSLWVKIGGEGFETRVDNDVLQIKARSAMLGYLNAPSPFTEDGWFDTGDAVEVEGEYLRILGRKSEIINVGGEKVYPTEVESIIQEFDNIRNVLAYGAPNSITGQMVCVKINLCKSEDDKVFKKRLKRFCRGKLLQYQMPMKIEVVDTPLHGDRFKKLRS